MLLRTFPKDDDFSLLILTVSFSFLNLSWNVLPVSQNR